jgi:hypothetical protein
MAGDRIEGKKNQINDLMAAICKRVPRVYNYMPPSLGYDADRGRLTLRTWSKTPFTPDALLTHAGIDRSKFDISDGAKRGSGNRDKAAPDKSGALNIAALPNGEPLESFCDAMLAGLKQYQSSLPEFVAQEECPAKGAAARRS